VLVGVGHEDTDEDVAKVAQRICKLRLWPGSEGKPWKESVKDINGDVLCGK
jgi:D-tyrosyl-tRNA(Tyr) deacylase